MYSVAHGIQHGHVKHISVKHRAGSTVTVLKPGMPIAIYSASVMWMSTLKQTAYSDQSFGVPVSHWRFTC
jgi:hypothetical protein